MKFDPHAIKAAATAVDRVKSIDVTIETMGRRFAESSCIYGEKIRNAFGRNILNQLTDEHLGNVVFCSIINALLADRESVINGYGDIVEFPDAPCPEQRAPSPQNAGDVDA